MQKMETSQLFFLLVLLSVLTSGWGQPDLPPVYLSLGSTTITINNTEILITDIGEGTGTLPVLNCHTKVFYCCRGSDSLAGVGHGEWYYPDGSVIQNSAMSTGAFFRGRGHQVVFLARRESVNTPSPTGSYCCEVPTAIEFFSGVILQTMTFCANLVTSQAPTTTTMSTTMEMITPTTHTELNHPPTVTAPPVITCPDLTTPASGTVSYSGSTGSRPVGTMATYSCDTGYTLIGGSTRTCQSDGTWSGSASTCTAVSCGSPPSISNGSPGIPTSTGTVTYSCNTGYVLSGSATVTCQASGSWSTLPTCSTVICGSPPIISNGSRTLTGTTLGETATYSCDGGYLLMGSTTATCLSTGSWSTPPSCQISPPIYLSLSSTNYLSVISEIPLLSVGERPGNSLICHTDLAACCRQLDSGEEGGLGEWYYPNGSTVSEEGGLYVSRDDKMEISLNRASSAQAPGGLYCCVVPTSMGNDASCVFLESPSIPVTQSDHTGAVVGGVVVLLAVLAIACSVAAVLITYLVLRHKKERGREERSVPNELPLTEVGQSTASPSHTAPTYETMGGAYEEIDPSPSRRVKGDYDYTQNQAYMTTTASEGTVTQQ